MMNELLNQRQAAARLGLGSPRTLESWRLRGFGQRPGKRPGRRFSVEEDVRRLSEQLMPLSDRANRMLIRNLKAIKELRQGLVPAIAIGRAEHVTVTNGRNGRPRRNGIERSFPERDPAPRGQAEVLGQEAVDGFK